jgi:hypothetical protein
VAFETIECHGLPHRSGNAAVGGVKFAV